MLIEEDFKAIEDYGWDLRELCMTEHLEKFYRKEAYISISD
jgi:hypothetical protein